MTIKKEDAARFLQGQRAANSLIDSMRLRRLRRMSETESRCEFENLCETWATGCAIEPQGRTVEHRLRFLLARRKRFDKAARKGGLP